MSGWYAPAVSFMCRFCGNHSNSAAGSRWVTLRSGKKIRKCAACVAAGKSKLVLPVELPPVRTAAEASAS